MPHIQAFVWSGCEPTRVHGQFGLREITAPSPFGMGTSGCGFGSERTKNLIVASLRSADFFLHP
jgi:hypothetical protein